MHMKRRIDRVCGADVHKDLIVATITGDDVLSIRENFGTTKAELERDSGTGWLPTNANKWHLSDRCLLDADL